jgi:probable phosphoglycerate mutase
MKARIPPPGSARLFSDALAAGPPAGVHIANIDGASRGNPGPAAYAVVLRDPESKIVLELAKKIGRETNNVAEYYALLAALDYAVNQGIGALRVRSDSELLVRQMQGRYKVKSSELKPLHERASKLARQLGYFAIEHVRRELNRDADALANVALDSGNVSAATAASPSRASAMNIARSVPPPASAPAAAAARSTFSTPSTSFSRVSVRARVVKGVLVPIEPLDLPEGACVEVDLLIPRAES